MGQFYGEISVIFFLSFRLKTAAFSLRAFGVFVSTLRERRMFLFERSRLFLEEFLSAFLSRRRRCPFFSQKENKQSSFLSFLLLCLSFAFFFFRSFHTRETCVLRRKVISHIVII